MKLVGVTLALAVTSLGACGGNRGLVGPTTDGGAAVGLGAVDAGVPSVAATPGCGRAPGQPTGMLVRGSIQTTGVKAPDCADTRCGAWSFGREYFLRLPASYDNTRAYPLVFEGGGCGSHGNNIYRDRSLDDAAIRVGLTPSFEASAFHPISPNQGCFDDRDGDNSVDWIFYENLYDKLATEICFDRNRVFAAGTSSGARMANELGCKYAGDAVRPIRGVMTHDVGLPLDAKSRPICTTRPMAGIWIDQINNPQYDFAETTLAVTRAMSANGCPPGASYETAELEPFDIKLDDPTKCTMVGRCSPLFPLAVCSIPYVQTIHNDESVVAAGWTTFLTQFEP